MLELFRRKSLPSDLDRIAFLEQELHNSQSVTSAKDGATGGAIRGKQDTQGNPVQVRSRISQHIGLQPVNAKFDDGFRAVDEMETASNAVIAALDKMSVGA